MPVIKDILSGPQRRESELRSRLSPRTKYSLESNLIGYRLSYAVPYLNNFHSSEAAGILFVVNYDLVAFNLNGFLGQADYSFYEKLGFVFGKRKTITSPLADCGNDS